MSKLLTAVMVSGCSIAFIAEPVDVRAILEHIGEPATPPRIAQARGPPEWHEDAAEHASRKEVG